MPLGVCVYVCVTLHAAGTHFIKLIRIDLWHCASAGTSERLAAQALQGEWSDSLRLKNRGRESESEPEPEPESKWNSGEGIFLAPFASRVLKMLKYHSACSVKSLSLFLLLLLVVGVGWWWNGSGRSKGCGGS